MAKTKEEKAEVRRLYYLKNKEYLKKKAKEWTENNRERYLKRGRDYANSHKKEAVARATRWKKENRERYISQRSTLEASIFFKRNAKRIYEILKKNSKRVGRKFLLGKEEFVNWHNGAIKICCYCGVSEETLYKNFNINRLQIERVDNTKPYEITNLNLACQTCNKIKSNLLTSDEMHFIGKHIISKKWKIKQ